MKKSFFILFIIAFPFYVKAQTGIGTTTPVNKFEVVTATADPANTGATANGNLRLGPSTGSHVLDFGLSSGSTYSWLQARSKSAYGTTYNLALNPIGGSVGIGTSAPVTTLTVGNTTGTIPGEITLNPTTASFEGGQINFKKSLIGSTADWTMDQYGTSSADARFRIFNGGSETNGLVIFENGNLGISNSSPSDKLVVGSSFSLHDGGNKVIGLGWSPGSGNSLIAGYPAEIRLDPSSGKLFFGTDPTLRTISSSAGVQRRMTITPQGNIGIGLENPGSRLHLSGADNNTMYIQSSTSDNNGMLILNATTNQNWSSGWHEFMLFQNQGTTVGYIGAAPGGNGVVYSTTSDYRLKTDLKNYNGLDLVNKIKTYDYAWKTDSSRMYGVMAHELQSVLPYAATGQKDAVDADGKIIPQAVDYSKLTPILIKAIQEQDIKIKEQERNIIKLNNDNSSLEKRIKSLEILIKKIKHT